MTKPLLALLLCVPLALFCGCSDSDTNSPTADGEGQLRISLVDAPAAYDAVNIEIIGVSVHRADEDSLGGWFDVAIADTMHIDLLSLVNGSVVALADTLLPAGDYTQIRLLLGAGNSVVFDGVEHPLTIPSGMTSGLKIQFPFTIEHGMLYEVTLDFDASRSIHVTGNGRWMMRPVIRAAAHGVSGSVFGTVSPAEALAVITAIAGDDTFGTYADPASGGFALIALPEGFYDVTVAPTAGSYSDTTLAGVQVTAMQHTDLGLIELTGIIVEPPAQ